MRKKLLSILALLLTAATHGAWALDTDASGAYLINSTDDWNEFATSVNGGNSYSGKTVKLTCDISVTTKCGTVSGQTLIAPFSGTFDGGGKTITATITDEVYDGTALFCCIKDATIKNLKVAGTINGVQHSAAIVGFAAGTSRIENCLATATVNCSKTHVGSILGHCISSNYNASTIVMAGCVFSGLMTGGGSKKGGLIGWGSHNSIMTISNCLYVMAEGQNLTNLDLIGYWGENTTSTLTNIYKTVNAGSYGKYAHTISAGEGVSSLSGNMGSGTTYGVSGITAYATGIEYDGKFYASNGEEVSLTLSHDTREGYTFSQYTCNPATLSAQTETSATLTMTDANQTISVEWTENEVTLTDGQPITALTTFAGQKCTVTYKRSFTSGKASTVCLPFAYEKKAADGSFYEFTNIGKDGNEYVATMTEPGVSTLTANTPYLYMPNATGDVDFSGLYDIPSSLTAGTTTSNGWTFKGNYEAYTWEPNPTGIYGFAGENANDGITQGQFVKVGTNVRIDPMRCYLENASFAGARGMERAEQLPETIKVRLVSANGEVTAIGSLQTKTGEVTPIGDTWHSLDGRRMAGKPATKGIYINNNKKVIIK